MLFLPGKSLTILWKQKASVIKSLFSPGLLRFRCTCAFLPSNRIIWLDYRVGVVSDLQITTQQTHNSWKKLLLKPFLTTDGETEAFLSKNEQLFVMHNNPETGYSTFKRSSDESSPKMKLLPSLLCFNYNNNNVTIMSNHHWLSQISSLISNLEQCIFTHRIWFDIFGL